MVATREPSLIADDMHVRYRIMGASKATRTAAASRSRGPIEVHRRHRSSFTEVHAIRGVSLVAHHGESIGIIGRNGAGKSTLLKALAGLVPASSGRVYVSSQPLLLGVSAAMVPALTGERNIMLGCLALGLSRREARERMDDIVDFAGIGDFAYLPMNTYSSGMQARLRFAISASVVPEILMIDEALSTGDAEFRKKSTLKMQEIREQAGTIFLVSHSNSSIEENCERAIWIDEGIIRADGPTSDVLDEYTNSQKS